MRRFKVVALLLALGATAGALVGVLMLLGLRLLGQLALNDVAPRALAAATVLGALAGAILGPTLALLFMRRVPLWRATVETAGAAALGLVVGDKVSIGYGWIFGPLIFAIAAALRLNHVYRAAAARDVPRPTEKG